MSKTKLFLNILFSLSIIYLATSIVFFSFTLNDINKELPNILNSIETIEKKIDLDAILNTADRTVKEIPNILKETKNVREEITQIRKILPSILKQVDSTNKNIPIILKELEQTRKTLPSIINESKEIRGTIHNTLKESQALRKDLPIQIDKADKIIQTLDGISSGGIVGDTIKSVINIPKNIVDGVNSTENNGTEINYIDDDDY